ncbi:MAG: DUF4398 domain-containing protein [Burkholderiales bacterium]|nr:DUF4398 domain-containing protein [Burkholderiales bacterium]
MTHRSFTKASCTVAMMALVFAAGCASVPAPTDQMALSHAAVSEAQSAGAPEFAPVEFRSAQARLEEARTAFQGENYVVARRAAERAEVDAKLAETKARSAKANRAVAELRQGIEVLREEIERKSN